MTQIAFTTNELGIDGNIQPGGRFHFLDAMRGQLMLLGVVYHAAVIYQTNGDWLIHDVKQSAFFSFLAYFIHQFRMPAFFVIAGFFCPRSLAKRTPIQFIREKVRRILVPLCCCAIFLNSVESFVLLRHQDATQNFWHFITRPDYWYTGAWVSHLWFLNCLTIYYLFAAFYYGPFRSFPSRVSRYFTRITGWMTSAVFFFVLLPLMGIALQLIYYYAPVKFPKYFAFLELPSAVHYAPFFIWGILMGTQHCILETFSRWRWYLPPAILAGICMVQLYPFERTWLEIITKRYLETFVPWGLVSLCFWLYSHVFSQVSKVSGYLSDASYSVYLFHQLIVIYLGLLLMKADLNVYIKFLIVLIGASIVSTAIHHNWIRRFALLRMAFNGKRPV